MTIAIIGGGASGMAAAIAAAQNPMAQVILLERQSRVGRKLLATGNGRCNLSNVNTTLQNYHGEDASFAAQALEQFPVENTLSWFRSLGLHTVREVSGRIYPYSDQANSVVDVLRFALDKPNITVCTGVEVTAIRQVSLGYELVCGENTVSCQRLIVACGGIAGSKLGGSMSGYRLLSKLGYRCTKLRPNLVQIKSDWHGLAGLKGVRAQCKAEIYRNDTCFVGSTGEIQFTEQGLSGPVIFEISRDVCSTPGQWVCKLDFIPQMCEKNLYQELLQRTKTNLPSQELLTGILHNRLGRVLTQAAGISSSRVCSELNDEDLSAVIRCIKEFEISLTEPLGMDSAQVTAGGILTSQFDPCTMESRLHPGLYVCGELLDIDGDCGGYNLQWAWSSGRVAGMNAGKDCV